MQLRRSLWTLGLRYRTNVQVLAASRRRPDIVFPARLVAVFVDGCFWHVCPEHATWPRENADWWRQKLESNVARDRETDAQLRGAGWVVLRVWEHESAASAAQLVAETVRARPPVRERQTRL
jgi:DNA mismatch endonuclease, patch repair protein